MATDSRSSAAVPVSTTTCQEVLAGGGGSDVASVPPEALSPTYSARLPPSLSENARYPRPPSQSGCESAMMQQQARTQSDGWSVRSWRPIRQVNGATGSCVQSAGCTAAFSHSTSTHRQGRAGHTWASSMPLQRHCFCCIERLQQVQVPAPDACQHADKARQGLLANLVLQRAEWHQLTAGVGRER